MVARRRPVDTGKAKRDEHLRTEDFFDVERFPTMVVRVDAVRLTAADRGAAVGRITVLGETRPVTLELAIDLAGPRGVATVRATGSIGRAAFGMTKNPAGMIGTAIGIDATLVLRRDGGEA